MNVRASLNAARRASELERLAAGEPVDVLVVGGGITGAGVALDASSRGLRVALLERNDLASGTSRWSSKLVHGGLRYLSHLQVGLAWECARERDALMRTVAPHLIRPLPMLVPLTPDWPRSQRGLVRIGARVGDGLRALAGTSGDVLPPARTISALEGRRLVPGLTPTGLRGGVLTWDGQLEDDARLVVAVARTAAAHGAAIITGCPVLEVMPDGVRAQDTETGQELRVRAKQVVLAAGAWTAGLAEGVRLAPSKGAHVIVEAAALGHPRAAISVPVGREWGRFVFAAPIADERVLIGLTDDPYDGEELEAPPVEAADRAFLLETISRALGKSLTEVDVRGEFAGVRPLLASAGQSFDLSRDHALIEDPETGAISLVGGKLTTYRRMAEDAVDLAVLRAGLRAGPCRTRRLPLIGATTTEPAAMDAVPPRLARRYGAEARDITALAAGRPELLDPVADTVPTLRAELLFGALHEGARSVDDLLDRRTRLGLIPTDRAAALPAARDALEEATGLLAAAPRGPL